MIGKLFAHSNSREMHLERCFSVDESVKGEKGGKCPGRIYIIWIGAVCLYIFFSYS